MRSKFILLLLFTAYLAESSCQTEEPFRYEPYFNAVIVKAIDSSAAWYQSVFEMKVINRINDSLREIRVVIMEAKKFLLELIENKSWPDQKKLLSREPVGARIQGFFKMGFKTPDIDICLKHLAGLRIIPEKIYTDTKTKKRNFLINDPDGNLIQFFE
jgi:hypothetical protein